MYQSIGAETLVKKYESPLGVAEALILGKLSSYEQYWVGEVVGKTMLEAARIRLEASGQLAELAKKEK